MIYIKNVTNVTQTLHQNVTNVTKQNIASKEILTIEFHTKYMKLFVNTVLSLINAPGGVAIFQKGDVYKRQVFNAKMQCLSLFTMTRRREI